jgi:outer membrane protein TolC
MVKSSDAVTVVALVMGIFAASGHAQSAPPSPDEVWHPRAERSLSRELAARPEAKYDVDPGKRYTLAELIDLAQRHNPETRVTWAEAKARAASLGIARSALYPTIAAVALAATVRDAALLGPHFDRQTLGVFEPTLHVEYLLFDFGGRGGAIDIAKANLLASDLAFNDTHRKIIFQAASAYYRLLNARGQREAAEVSLKNAQTVEDDAQNRLANGGSQTGCLEATAADTVDFDLQAAVGVEDIARGDLATVIGLPPGTEFQVQGIGELSTPDVMADSIDAEMDRALKQRPELLQQVARIRAADASAKQARSTYFPTLNFSGDGGLARAYGQQDLLPGSYAQGETWVWNSNSNGRSSTVPAASTR